MAKLTKAQDLLIKKIRRSKSYIYFSRDHKGIERCYIGRNRVNSRVFFFLYDIGYLRLNSQNESKGTQYYYMRILNYKLEEYLTDYKQPYVLPE